MWNKKCDVIEYRNVWLFRISHHPTLEDPRRSMRFWWMPQYFGWFIHLLLPPHIHPEVFPNLGFLIPSFIPSDTSCSGLDFTDWKPNTRTKRGTIKAQESRRVKGERPTSKLTTGCESVTLASTLAPFSFFFACPFLPFLLLFYTSSSEGKLNICLHSGRLEWSQAHYTNVHRCKP